MWSWSAREESFGAIRWISSNILGILKFTTRVVRVGGMCKNDSVNEYNLFELRLKKRDTGLLERSPVNRNIRRIRLRVVQLRKEINQRQEIANQAAGWVERATILYVAKNWSSTLFYIKKKQDTQPSAFVVWSWS